MTPNGLYAQAVELARRGFAAVVVMRRGYGNSGGGYAENSGPCARRNYMIAANASAADLRAAIDAMNRRADVTTQGMIALVFPPADLPASRCRPIRRRASPP